MHTLFDFVTHIKTVEYLIGLSFILGFILFWEILKPRPFKTLVSTTSEDIQHIRKTGMRGTLKNIGMVVSAPFIGLAYIVMLPFAFAFALGTAALRGVLSIAGGTASFGWRPMEAYFSGKKRQKEDSKDQKEQE